MPEWIDFALMADEVSLSQALGNLTDRDRDAAIKEISQRLNVSDSELKSSVLRLLIERIRPFALPASLWNRSITDSDDPRSHVRRHFASQGISESEGRLNKAIRLYNQFVVDRGERRVPITTEKLAEVEYRCEHCGLRFYNEELASRALESPWRNRRRDKSDPLKPHWANKDVKLREPTVDHDWPISLFGDNTESNLKVLCRGCNSGKEKFMAMEQMKPFTGLPARSDLLKTAPVSFDVFYAQLRRSPTCWKTGKSRGDVELTVCLIDPTVAPLLDNLRTVESPD